MGYYFAPEFGKKEGQICKEECKHWDCQALRKQLKILCSVCGEKIEPGNPIYFDKIEDGKVVAWSHFRCVHGEK